jgi:hypothetical protein
MKTEVVWITFIKRSSALILLMSYLDNAVLCFDNAVELSHGLDVKGKGKDVPVLN